MCNLLQKAVEIALEAHKGQKDKGGHDYILHPLRVACNCNSDDERIVAVLHDTIEDTDVTYDYLRKLDFPEYIIEVINSVTRRDGESYMDYIRRAKLNKLGREVKLRDLEDNMNLNRIKNPTEKDYNRLKKYQKAKKILEED